MCFIYLSEIYLNEITYLPFNSIIIFKFKKKTFEIIDQHYFHGHIIGTKRRFNISSLFILKSFQSFCCVGVLIKMGSESICDLAWKIIICCTIIN